MWCRCVIPVLVQSSNERKFKLPFGLRALKPVSVPVVSGRSLANCCISDKHWKPAMSDIDALFLDNMTRMLNERLYLKMEREKVQKKKLEMWIQEKQMQRYVEQERERLEEEKERMRLQQLLERQLYEQRQLVNDLNTTEQSQVTHHVVTLSMRLLCPKTSVLETIRKPPLVKAQTAFKQNKYGEKGFSIWQMEFLRPAMLQCGRIMTLISLGDSMTAPCNVACGSGIMTVNSPSGSTLQCDT